MKKVNIFIILFGLTTVLFSQNVMTPEQLITLNRVSAVGLTDDLQSVIYTVSKVDLQENNKSKKTYILPLSGGEPELIENYADLISDRLISADGKYEIYAKDVKIKPVHGQDFYKDVPESNVKIYESLNYRHWDTWEDGSFSHLFIRSEEVEIDLMKEEPFDCPQKPFGGDEDYIWSPDSKKVLYVAKKSYGTEYTVTTNSDIYEYNLETQKTTNLTAYNKGYDVAPSFSSKGDLAWLQMKRDGYEADKNDIIIRRNGMDINLTKDWDGTVNSFV